RARGADPPLHDGDRVHGPAARARPELPDARAEAGAARAPLPEAPAMILASGIWTQLFWTTAVAGGLAAGVPLMFTSLGEAISERAGVLNIGLEGMMLFGAYFGFLATYYGHSVWLGYLAGAAAGAASALFMVVLC